jgi:hypothetical protein
VRKTALFCSCRELQSIVMGFVWQELEMSLNIKLIFNLEYPMCLLRDKPSRGKLKPAFNLIR